MVRELDRRMVGWAIELIARSEAEGRPICYEVNLSARSLADRGFRSFIAESVEEAAIDPSLLVFEITETAAIANMDQAQRFASSLRELGCGFALDDFGTGFASFYYLKHIPLDALKIDGDFIRHLRSNTDRPAAGPPHGRDRRRASASTRSPSSSRTRRRSRSSRRTGSMPRRVSTSAVPSRLSRPRAWCCPGTPRPRSAHPSSAIELSRSRR